MSISQAEQTEADEAYEEWQASKLLRDHNLLARLFKPTTDETWVSVPTKSKKITK